MAQLFEDQAPDPTAIAQRADEPLATRMRPREASELVGQSQLLAAGLPLAEALAGRNLHSMILYGPPGTGKTTIARLLANVSDAAFEEESAVAAGRAEVRAAIERARERRQINGRGTIFFLDEIHRFNKAQQDALLPAVEDGTLTLIGATTENPFFEVNSALLSRARIYELQSLTADDVRALIERAVAAKHGLASKIEVTQEAILFLADQSGGDARIALGALESASRTAPQGKIDLKLAQDALQRKAILYDKGADQHYDFISAFIKAMRGSDPDAALYYLAVMLEGGEDARFIARRIIVLASEDIGNADPNALPIAIAAAQAVEHVGLPEARINLGHAVTYMALAPKSNAAYVGINRALSKVKKEGAKLPPDFLRDGHYKGAEQLGRGVGYVYPHDLPAGVSHQSLLPEEVRGATFYEPSNHGFERDLGERYAAIKRARERDK